MLLRHEGSHLGRRVLGITDAEPRRRVGEQTDETVVRRSSRRAPGSSRSSPDRRSRTRLKARARPRDPDPRRRTRRWRPCRPSSSVTRLIPAAALRITSAPASVEPVNATFATSGCSTSRVPTVWPGPTTAWSTPSGMPASEASSHRRMVLRGVSDAGFTTTVFPQHRAGPIFHEAMRRGKFHGTMAATTPSGSWNVALTPPDTGMVLPLCLSTAPA